MPPPKAHSPRTPVPRYRAYDGPAVLSQGFRPFFLLAALWALFAVPVALSGLLGVWPWSGAMGPVSWHSHEMLFGYLMAVVAGYLMTAIPNWTGRMPLQGWALLGLVALWALGRAAVACSTSFGPALTAIADLAFPYVFLAAVSREILAGRNWRNLLPLCALAALVFCNTLFHWTAWRGAETGGLEARAAIGVAVCLIALFGGRLVPSFTRNWLAKQRDKKLPAPFDWIDRAALGATAAAMASWTFGPDASLSAALALLAGVANLVRLWRWRGLAVTAQPALWPMHLAYLWLPIGLMLIALGIWWPAMVQGAALHGLTIGAIGSMTLAVMSRTTAMQTGRPLHTGPALPVCVVLLSLGAAARVLAPLTELEMPLLWLAAMAWMGAFALFLIVWGPMLIGPRPHRGADRSQSPSRPNAAG
jgi:uncharacterized protein involved in response to NO